MTRPFFAALGLALQASFASAAITVSSTSTPVSELPGFVRETLTANAAPGEKIIGFDFVGGPIKPDFGFIGPMNQILPGGQPGVFADLEGICSFFQECVATGDSHFKVFSSQGLPVLPSESSNSLKAAFAFTHPSLETVAAQSLTFVQIVHSAEVSYRGELIVKNALGEDRLEPVSGILAAVPEPASTALMFIATFGSLTCRRPRATR